MGSEWVGFKNFEFFFNGKDWMRVTLNTVFLNALFLVTGLSGAVLLAIFLNEIRNRLFKRITQSFIFTVFHFLACRQHDDVDAIQHIRGAH